MNVTCPIACAVEPSPIPGSTWRNSSSSATPITISGVTSGSSMTVLIVPPPGPRQRCNPSARATPSGVAMSTQTTPRKRVWRSAPCSAGSCSTLPLSPVNQRVEKPCHVVRERPLLKANRIAIPTGISDQRT